MEERMLMFDFVLILLKNHETIAQCLQISNLSFILGKIILIWSKTYIFGAASFSFRYTV